LQPARLALRSIAGRWQAGLRNLPAYASQWQAGLRIKEDIFIEVNFTITGYKVPERQLIKQGYQKNGQKSLIGNFSLILS